MIIRKPYAFLIKHFKKLHIVLLILSVYIYYKTIKLNGFVSEFVSLGTYEPSIDSITNYISILFFISVFLSILGSVLLVLLLRYKGKPWKLYMVPLIEYSILFFLMILTQNFFNSYTGTSTGMDIRLIRDVIFITTIVQFPIFIIYIIRILGVDLNRFNFKLDEEYLEMKEEDREELEISFNIDYHVFIRTFNKIKRYIKYFYFEHKKICNIVIIILSILLLWNAYNLFFVKNKNYKQGEVYNANGYTIIVKDAYYSDKDYKGKIIEKNNAFVIVKLNIKNNYGRRVLRLDNFHVLNGTNNYKQQSKTYSPYFEDFGKTDDITKELQQNASTNTTLIFKVNKKDKVNRFALYYQEINGRDTYLRKIKIKIKDISKLEKIKEKKLNENFNIKTENVEETISFDHSSYTTNVLYSRRECTRLSCEIIEENMGIDEEHKILKINYSSIEIDGRELIDFLSKYGTIKYEDKDGTLNKLKIKNVVNKNYIGKELYIEVPNEIIDSKKVYMDLIIRTKQYRFYIEAEVENE